MAQLDSTSREHGKGGRKNRAITRNRRNAESAMIVGIPYLLRWEKRGFPDKQKVRAVMSVRSSCGVAVNTRLLRGRGLREVPRDTAEAVRVGLERAHSAWIVARPGAWC